MARSPSSSRRSPRTCCFDRALDLPPGKPEQEVYSELAALAARNTSAEDEVTFLGAGMYDHYVPALIDTLMGRAEFLTPYTPYQPEISQGGLQVMFEYQTAISELTGLPISNASLYEGPSAVGAAAYLAKLANGRTRHLVSRGVHPHSRETLETLAVGYGTTVEEIPLTDGLTDLDRLVSMLDDQVGVVILQQPNFLGSVEDLKPLVDAAKEVGALVVCSCDPIPLGILEPPGARGVDVAVGEGQSLGNRLDFGGPSFGFFAASQEHIRRMPGRIAGETKDVDGRRGLVLTLQTREQHIRREKATSNICTAQALNALAGVVYLSWLGREGLVELGELLAQTHCLRANRAGCRRWDRAAPRSGGRPRVRGQPRCPGRSRDRAMPGAGHQPRLRPRHRLPRIPNRPAGRAHGAARPGRHRPPRRGPRRGGCRRAQWCGGGSMSDMASAQTAAQHAAGELGEAVESGSRPARGGETPQQREHSRTIYEKSKTGRRAFVPPPTDVPDAPLADLIPARLLRSEPARLPEVAEPELVRHYTRLSKRNFDLDSGFYPLGSCTMKHNPRLHERVAALPGHARLHPLQSEAHSQGALELMYNLQHALGEVAGLPHVSLQPSAGSHGELAGVLLTQRLPRGQGRHPHRRSSLPTPLTAPTRRL